VKGITLAKKNDAVVGMVVVRREGFILTVAENGYGKRTKISDYHVQRRGGRGVITITCSERNGDVLTLQEVVDSDELMLITRNGLIIRQGAHEISVIGRNTQGVRLMNMGEGDVVVDIARVAEEEINGGENNNKAQPDQEEPAEDIPSEEISVVEEAPAPEPPAAVKKTAAKKTTAKKTTAGSKEDDSEEDDSEEDDSEEDDSEEDGSKEDGSKEDGSEENGSDEDSDEDKG